MNALIGRIVVPQAKCQPFSNGVSLETDQDQDRGRRRRTITRTKRTSNSAFSPQLSLTLPVRCFPTPHSEFRTPHWPPTPPSRGLDPSTRQDHGKHWSKPR